MRLTNNISDHKAVVLTANKFEDTEVLVPVFRLLEEGWHVDIAAPTLEEIEGEGGYKLFPDLTIESVDPDQYELLIIPGGYPDGAPFTVSKIQRAQEITRAFFAKNKSVVSICHGPWLLATADVVKGRRLTSYWEDGVPNDIRNAGGTWVDEEVVVDGNLVTSRWPADLPAFCREMMKLLRGGS